MIQREGRIGSGKRGIGKKENRIIAVLFLCAGLLLLWIIFYNLTIRAIHRNMILQAETGSETIISDMEEELLALENNAYELAHEEPLKDALRSEGIVDFYDSTAAYLRDNSLLMESQGKKKQMILFRRDGLYYRMNGTMPNTALRRIFTLMDRGVEKTLVVNSGNTAYIGSYKEITENGEVLGFAAVLMEKTQIDRILTSYSDLDYLGEALLSGDKVLTASRDFRMEELPELRERAVFLKEKEIGLSGFRLLVWCENELGESLARYFWVALPVTILILLLVRALFRAETKIRESELVRERTLMSLLKKQINAHFTVNTLSVLRALIRKGEKETATETCDELSTLLRYANAGEEYISLLEEFFVLEQYTAIMQTRFRGKLNVEIEADDSFSGVYIPRMLLQPILENAILHGLAGSEGRICVNAEVFDEKELRIVITDNGKGMSARELELLRERIRRADVTEERDLHHIALENIQRRIRILLGEEYGLSIDSEPGKGTRVRVLLPIILEPSQKVKIFRQF